LTKETKRREKRLQQTFRKSVDEKKTVNIYQREVVSSKQIFSSFALAFTGIFGVFLDLGLSTLTVREVARDK